MNYQKLQPAPALPSWSDRFGIRGPGQVRRDVGKILSRSTEARGLPFGLRSAGLLRPELALPAYAGFVPTDGISPIFNFFDRTGGGAGFAGVATRRRMRDWRGGKLSYDEHDGTDFVCPPGTPLVAAAPGILVCYRDQWLRGGLTACVDHGSGVTTQYTHLSQRVAEPGQSLQRGDVVALSGHSGIDMTTFFPWVPPHVHFMAWVDGRPVDPFLAPGDVAPRSTWLRYNEPCSSGPIADDKPLRTIDGLDLGAIARLTEGCLDPAVRLELESAPSDAARAAILEDSLHHERAAWTAEHQSIRIRRPSSHRVPLSMPLPASIYRSARAFDTRWTAPES